MNILIVAPVDLTSENNNGVAKIVLNLIKYSIEKNKISVISKGMNNELSLVIDNSITYAFQISLFRKIVNFLTFKPIASYSKCANRQLLGVIKSLESDFDIIHLFTYELAPVCLNLMGEFSRKIRLSLIDFNYLFFKRRAELEGNIFKKVLFYLEAYKYFALEKKLVKKCVPLHLVSSKDSDDFKLNHGVKIFCAENGVEIKNFTKLDKQDLKNDGQIVFFGNLDYAPNKLAVEFIAKKLSPLFISRNIPHKFIIVGKYRSKFPITPNVVYTGFVENLNELVANSRLVIFPLFFGAGIKNKVLEAIAAGVQIIATPTALDGILLKKDQRQVAIVDSFSPEEWLFSIKQQLLAKKQFDPIDTLRYSYTWERFGLLMEMFYQDH